jgi:hypothetical protein
MTVWMRIPFAAMLAAGLAAGQLALAELVGITTLDADFAAGNERVQGVQITLLAWYTAVAVAVAVTVAARRQPVATTAARAVTAPVAALGALAAAPVAAAFSGPALAGEVWPAVITGALLGAAATLAVLAVPAVGDGIAIHAGLLWLAAVILTLLLPRTVTYAGVVEPLDLELPSALGSAVRAVPVLERYDYHLPSMLPVGVGVVLLSAVLAVRAVRRTGARAAAVAAGVAGPWLATAGYLVRPDALFLWNEDAFAIVLLIAVCCALAATVAVLVAGRKSPRAA